MKSPNTPNGHDKHTDYDFVLIDEPQERKTDEEFAYSVSVKLLKRFFKLYEQGRKNGAPQSYIDYFQAEHFVLTEVEKAVASRHNYEEHVVDKNK